MATFHGTVGEYDSEREQWPVSRYFGDPLFWGPRVPNLPEEWGPRPQSTGRLGTPVPNLPVY